MNTPTPVAGRTSPKPLPDHAAEDGRSKLKETAAAILIMGRQEHRHEQHHQQHQQQSSEDTTSGSDAAVKMVSDEFSYSSMDSERTLTEEQVRQWPTGDVCLWLAEIGLGHLQHMFQKAAVTGGDLFLMNPRKLTAIGVQSVRDREHLLDAIDSLNSTVEQEHKRMLRSGSEKEMSSSSSSSSLSDAIDYTDATQVEALEALYSQIDPAMKASLAGRTQAYASTGDSSALQHPTFRNDEAARSRGSTLTSRRNDSESTTPTTHPQQRQEPSMQQRTSPERTPVASDQPQASDGHFSFNFPATSTPTQAVQSHSGNASQYEEVGPASPQHYQQQRLTNKNTQEPFSPSIPDRNSGPTSSTLSAQTPPLLPASTPPQGSPRLGRQPSTNLQDSSFTTNDSSMNTTTASERRGLASTVGSRLARPTVPLQRQSSLVTKAKNESMDSLLSSATSTLPTPQHATVKRSPTDVTAYIDNPSRYSGAFAGVKDLSTLRSDMEGQADGTFCFFMLAQQQKQLILACVVDGKTLIKALVIEAAGICVSNTSTHFSSLSAMANFYHDTELQLDDHHSCFLRSPLNASSAAHGQGEAQRGQRTLQTAQAQQALQQTQRRFPQSQAQNLAMRRKSFAEEKAEQSLQSIIGDIENQPWFYGPISRADAGCMLRYEADGCFLVRTRKTNTNASLPTALVPAPATTTTPTPADAADPAASSKQDATAASGHDADDQDHQGRDHTHAGKKALWKRIFRSKHGDRHTASDAGSHADTDNEDGDDATTDNSTSGNEQRGPPTHKSSSSAALFNGSADDDEGAALASRLFAIAQAHDAVDAVDAVDAISKKQQQGGGSGYDDADVSFEVMISFQGGIIRKHVEKSPVGVRFEGGHAIYETLEVLILSYQSSAGDELPTMLTHSPGQPPSILRTSEEVVLHPVINAYGRADEKSPLSTTAGFQAFLDTVHPDGLTCQWWADSEEEAKNATQRISCEPDGSFFMRHGGQHGTFVLTYHYKGGLYTDLVQPTFKKGKSKPRLFLTQNQGKEFATLADLVRFLAHPNSFTRCPLRLPFMFNHGSNNNSNNTSTVSASVVETKASSTPVTPAHPYGRSNTQRTRRRSIFNFFSKRRHTTREQPVGSTEHDFGNSAATRTQTSPPKEPALPSSPTQQSELKRSKSEYALEKAPASTQDGHLNVPRKLSPSRANASKSVSDVHNTTSVSDSSVLGLNRHRKRSFRISLRGRSRHRKNPPPAALDSDDVDGLLQHETPAEKKKRLKREKKEAKTLEKERRRLEKLGKKHPGEQGHSTDQSDHVALATTGDSGAMRRGDAIQLQMQNPSSREPDAGQQEVLDESSDELLNPLSPHTSVRMSSPHHQQRAVDATPKKTVSTGRGMPAPPSLPVVTETTHGGYNEGDDDEGESLIPPRPDSLRGSSLASLQSTASGRTASNPNVHGASGRFGSGRNIHTHGRLAVLQQQQQRMRSHSNPDISGSSSEDLAQAPNPHQARHQSQQHPFPNAHHHHHHPHQQQQQHHPHLHPQSQSGQHRRGSFGERHQGFEVRRAYTAHPSQEGYFWHGEARNFSRQQQGQQKRGSSRQDMLQQLLARPNQNDRGYARAPHQHHGSQTFQDGYQQQVYVGHTAGLRSTGQSPARLPGDGRQYRGSSSRGGFSGSPDGITRPHSASAVIDATRRSRHPHVNPRNMPFAPQGQWYPQQQSQGHQMQFPASQVPQGLSRQGSQQEQLAPPRLDQFLQYDSSLLVNQPHKHHGGSGHLRRSDPSLQDAALQDFRGVIATTPPRTNSAHALGSWDSAVRGRQRSKSESYDHNNPLLPKSILKKRALPVQGDEGATEPTEDAPPPQPPRLLQKQHSAPTELTGLTRQHALVASQTGSFDSHDIDRSTGRGMSRSQREDPATTVARNIPQQQAQQQAQQHFGGDTQQSNDAGRDVVVVNNRSRRRLNTSTNSSIATSLEAVASPVGSFLTPPTQRFGPTHALSQHQQMHQIQEDAFFDEGSETSSVVDRRKGVRFANAPTVHRVSRHLEAELSLDWAWNQIGTPRADAVRVLRGLPAGAFILRQSESRESQYALTYVYGNTLYDERVSIDAASPFNRGAFQLSTVPDVVFSSLFDMLARLSMDENLLGCVLLMPTSLREQIKHAIASTSSPRRAAVPGQPRQEQQEVPRRPLWRGEPVDERDQLGFEMTRTLLKQSSSSGSRHGSRHGSFRRGGSRAAEAVGQRFASPTLSEASSTLYNPADVPAPPFPAAHMQHAQHAQHAQHTIQRQQLHQGYAGHREMVSTGALAHGMHYRGPSQQHPYQGSSSSSGNGTGQSRLRYHSQRRNHPLSQHRPSRRRDHTHPSQLPQQHHHPQQPFFPQQHQHRQTRGHPQPPPFLSTRSQPVMQPPPYFNSTTATTNAAPIGRPQRRHSEHGLRFRPTRSFRGSSTSIHSSGRDAPRHHSLHQSRGQQAHYHYRRTSQQQQLGPPRSMAPAATGVMSRTPSAHGDSSYPTRTRDAPGSMSQRVQQSHRITSLFSS